MKNIDKVGNFLMNHNLLPYVSILIVVLFGVAVFQKHGCQSNKPKRPACVMISTSPGDYKLDTPVPGVAYIAVTPNTPNGDHVGPGAAWGPQEEYQVVLAFQLFSKPGGSCQTPQVTGLVMEVNATTSKFVIGRSFTVFWVRSHRHIEVATGTVDNDGKINAKFLGGPLQLDPGDMQYFELRLDTSGAKPGDQLAVTHSGVDYQVGDKSFRSYQPRYTPPPLIY